MLQNDVIFRFFQISEICIGILGNSMLFIFYTHTYFSQPLQKKPIDLIFIHLTLVNAFSMFKLIPEITSSFAISHFLDDVGCKTILYTFRVFRGLPICTTTLLSLYQAITISPPSHSTSAWFKSRISTCIFPSLFSFWIINMIIYCQIIITVKSTHNISSSGYYQLYCAIKSVDESSSHAFLSFMMICDLIFVILMVWSSLYMVILLYRHHKRVRRVLSPNLSSLLSPEIKATQSIVLLVTCFVFFYCLNNFMTFYMFYSPDKGPHLEKINGILSSGYPTLCPIVLIRNSKIPFQCPYSISKVRLAFCHSATNMTDSVQNRAVSAETYQGEEMPHVHWTLEMCQAGTEATSEWKIHSGVKPCSEKEDLRME